MLIGRQDRLLQVTIQQDGSMIKKKKVKQGCQFAIASSNNFRP